MKRIICSILAVVVLVSLVAPVAMADEWGEWEELPDGSRQRTRLESGGPRVDRHYPDGTVYTTWYSGAGHGPHQSWRYPDGSLYIRYAEGGEIWEFPNSPNIIKKDIFGNHMNIVLNDGGTLRMSEVYDNNVANRSICIYVGASATIVGEQDIVYENVSIVGNTSYFGAVTLYLRDLNTTAPVAQPSYVLGFDDDPDDRMWIGDLHIIVTGSNSLMNGKFAIRGKLTISGDGTLETDTFRYPDDSTESTKPKPIMVSDNFVRMHDYTEGTFTDIDNRWYTEIVKNAFEFGIIQGVGNNQFNPDGQLTGNEALTIAARIHMVYAFGDRSMEEEYRERYPIGQDGNTWATPFIMYARDMGLISNELDKKLTTPITRAEMVFAWSRILQAEDMPQVNTVNSLPDVSPTTPFYNEIRMFYEAGIVQGSGGGIFNPNNSITRAECATIFMNLIEVSGRNLGSVFG